MLRFMGSPVVRHAWATELTECTSLCFTESRSILLAELPRAESLPALFTASPVSWTLFLAFFSNSECVLVKWINLQMHKWLKWECYPYVKKEKVWSSDPEDFPGGSDGKWLPKIQEAWVRSLGLEDPLEKEMATHSSILVWKIPWMEDPVRLQSMESQRVGHDWVTSLQTLRQVKAFKKMSVFPPTLLLTVPWIIYIAAYIHLSPLSLSLLQSVLGAV